MPNTELTQPNLKRRIENRLGGKGVQVELEADDYEEAVRATLNYYNQRRPFKRNRKLAANVTTKRYLLDPAQHPGLAGVTYVEFVPSTVAPGSIDVFNPYTVVGAGTSVGAAGETFGDLQQRITYTEDAARVINAEPEWHGDWDGANYYLYVDIVRSNLLVSYEWSGYYTPDANAQTGMQLIPNGDVDWFVRYAVACAKEVLARVRGKFQGITNPEGSQDPVDYQELLQESQQEKERLEDELNRRRAPLAPITG